jgi:hypothetical protein
VLKARSPNCPSPITKTLSKLIFGNASVDPEGYLLSEELSFNENLEVPAKIFAAKALDLRLKSLRFI